MDFGSAANPVLDWLEKLPPISTLILIAVTGLFGLLFGMVGKSGKTSKIKELEKKLDHSEKRLDSARQGKRTMASDINSIKNHSKEMTSFISLLPDAVEKLNTCKTRDDLLDSLIGITEGLLQAQDISIFLCDRDHLILKAHNMSQSLPESPLTIQIGEGKIGWVAQKGISMTDRDLEMESNLVRNNLADDHVSLSTKICSPLIYNGKLMGVINVGRLLNDNPHALKIARMISSLGSVSLGNVMLKDQIRAGSDKDHLTGLFSLQYFLNELGKELGKARRYKRPLALCHFNIDSFHHYNEKNGYLAGDEVLRMIGKILSDNVREQDMVARYEGGEFVLICPETKRQDAASLAEKLRKAIEDFPFPHKEMMPGGRVSVSGGVAGYPDDGTSEAELIRISVEATQKAMSSGRNKISQAGNTRESGKFSIK